MTPPYLLAIESSGRSASVAIAAIISSGATQPVGERMLDPAERTAKVLVPTIHELMSASGIPPRELTAVAVAVGPGSFTGLRIGITAAKTIAYATGAKLVGISTLDLLATQSGLPAGRRVWGVLDAQRGDLFVAKYESAARGTLGETDRTELVTSEQWLSRLAPGDLVVGPGAGRYADRLPDGVELAAEEVCLPRAGTVASLGAEMLERQLTSDPFVLVPRYHRLSAAEENARPTL